jgi:hypothetical protein
MREQITQGPIAWCKRSEVDDSTKKRQSFNGWTTKYDDLDTPLYTVTPDVYQLQHQVHMLSEALQHVCECLVLENMQRPHFTFARISKACAALKEYGEGTSTPVIDHMLGQIESRDEIIKRLRLEIDELERDLAPRTVSEETCQERFTRGTCEVNTFFINMRKDNEG